MQNRENLLTNNIDKEYVNQLNKHNKQQNEYDKQQKMYEKVFHQDAVDEIADLTQNNSRAGFEKANEFRLQENVFDSADNEYWTFYTEARKKGLSEDQINDLAEDFYTGNSSFSRANYDSTKSAFNTYVNNFLNVRNNKKGAYYVDKESQLYNSAERLDEEKEIKQGEKPKANLEDVKAYEYTPEQQVILDEAKNKFIEEYASQSQRPDQARKNAEDYYNGNLKRAGNSTYKKVDNAFKDYIFNIGE